MDKDSSQRQIFRMQEKALKDIADAIKKSVKVVKVDMGDVGIVEGKPGDTPIKGKDYFTASEKKAMVDDVFNMVKIPKAIPGEDGKDATIDYSKIEKSLLSKIKDGKDGKDGKVDYLAINKTIKDVVSKIVIPDADKVDYKEIEKLIEKYQSIRPLTNSAGPRTRLGEMVDVDVEGITNSQGLFWNSTTGQFEPGDGGGGSGDVATDTIWDTKGDVAIGTGAGTAVVIGVGTNGQVLTADSAEASGVKWSTIAGSGDMVLADVQTVTGAKTFEDTKLLLRNVADTFNGSFVNTNTADRIYTLQDSDGTLAFTSELHSAVTVTDTAEIDLILTGQDIKADIKVGSIDVLKLDAGVQTSLGLADSASQDIHANIAALDLVSGTNTGDQTSIVGITGTKAQFDTAVTDGNFMYIGDAPTSHTHVEADITDLQAYILADSTDTLTNKSIDADGTGNVITNIGFPEFDTDVADTMLFTAGAYLDQPSVSVASDGTTITLSIEQDGGGDLRILFLTGKYLWDTSPAATVTLTAGSNASPQMNYVYIDEATKTLQISTSGFPVADIVRVATVLCQSATSVQTDSPYKLHAWTDHMASSTCGHLSHINAWIRSQAATWIDGAVTTPTITTNAGTEDNVNIAISSGNVLQLHSQTFPAHDTAVSSDVHIVNKSGAAFTAVTDLNAADEDDAGNAITNNKWTNLVLWGAVNENNGKVFLNLPSAFHGSAGAATEDTEGYSNYSIPSDFTGVGFLIARLTLKYTTASGGTWAVVENKDLRGQLPTIVAGGGGSAGSEFPDNTFRIQDEGDVTKQIAFEASGITTANTRTLTVQDSDGTIALTSDLHDAVTVTDSAEIDFTLTGQDLTASLIAGSIDETKLDTSVNASLDLADSSTQPADIANFETTTQLNIRDTNNRARANHTGTQLASTISDFDTAVGTTALLKANNLSDLASAVTARTNLGLGTSAVTDTGTSSGNVPVLDGSGKINPSVLPALAISETSVVASEVAQLALTVQEGDIAVRTDENKSYIALNDTNATMSDWQELLAPTGAVSSVFGRSGAVIAQTNDYTFAQIDKTTSSLADLATRLISDTTGTLALARGGTGATTASTARTNLGLVIGTDVQAHSAVLDATTASFLTTDETKLDFISVTQAVDLDTMESNIATNNAKVTNATHTGEVTGSGVLTLNKTAISNQTDVTMVATDILLFGDTSDTNNLKKGAVQDILDLVPASGGLTWNEETGTSSTMSVANGYIANNAALVTFTLPTTASVGDIIRVTGKGAGGWKIAQNASEIIHFGVVDSTTGTGGSLASTETYDSVELVCIVANNEWVVISSVGNITIV